jgi:hypothetical protein
MKIPNTNDKNSPFLWVDIAFNIIAVLVVVLLLLSMTANKKEEKSAADIAGNLFITIRWPPLAPQDIDLWVQGPDGAPVGYSSSRSQTFSYLRDDLGAGTYKDMNYELAVGQNLVKGRYAVNLHFYSYHGGEGNVPVEVNAVLKSADGYLSEIFKDTVTLGKAGDEITAVQFQLDEAGWLIQGTVNNRFVPIRNKEKLFE